MKSSKDGKKENDLKEEFEAAATSGQKAKKDYHLCCPPHIDRKIKEGDDLSDIPKKFLPSLKAEGVL